MDEQRNNKNRPLCRFGPGGDFISIWPGEEDLESDDSLQRSNSLSGVLNSIAEILGTLLGSEPDGITAIRNVQGSEIGSDNRNGESVNAVSNEGIEKKSYAASIRVVKGDSGVSDEPMLFADDSGISGGDGHKPKHRVRAHKRIARKRPSVSVCGQGTLFGADLKSVRTA